MTLWLVRAGKGGEFEQRFLDDDAIYVTWESLNVDLLELSERRQLSSFFQEQDPEMNPAAASNFAGQVFPFAHDMVPGDWVVLPSKRSSRVLHFAEITGDYEYNDSAPVYYKHKRSVKWIAQDVPKDRFEQDLKYSFGAFMTICRIQRNDAEKRVRAMAVNNWQSRPIAPTEVNVESDSAAESDNTPSDYEQLSIDDIASLIERRFRGYELERLIEAILQAKGYHTYRGPEGADKGVDILAASGPLGLESPRICVQVKSTEAQVDRPTMDQLVGTMQNVGAEYGLLVSLSGFKISVERERAMQFFKVRLWGADDIIRELLENYNKLSPEIKSEIPLKQIWTVARPDQV
jgi:restriction system protein